MTGAGNPTPTSESYWVLPGRLLAGPYPGSWAEERTRARLECLLSAGVTVFVDLTEVGEGTPYAPLLYGRARHERRPIPDHGVPWPSAMSEILDLVDASLQMRKVIYVHCLAGLGRTGTVVGCYLARHGMGGADALQAVHYLRRGTPFSDDASPQTDAQRALVLCWKPGT